MSLTHSAALSLSLWLAQVISKSKFSRASDRKLHFQELRNEIEVMRKVGWASQRSVCHDPKHNTMARPSRFSSRHARS